MKILVLSPFNPKFLQEYLDSQVAKDINISANSVHTTIEGFIKMGHDVIIVTLDMASRSSKYYYGKQVQIYVVGGRFLFSYFNYAPLHTILAHKMIRVIDKMVLDFDVIFANWSYEYSLAALRYKCTRPVISVVRDWAPYIIKGVHIYLKPFWLRRIKLQKKILLDKKITIIANSIYTKERINSICPDREIKIIPNPIKKNFIIDKSIKKEKKYTFITLSATLTSKRKNIEGLLIAFSKFRKEYTQATLAIVGPPINHTKLYRKWNNSGLLKNVFFLGSMLHEQVINAIDDSLIMVHPSLEETFGNTLIEAMARCVPVIAGKDSGAVPWVLDYGNCGILCDVNDSDDLCKKMITLYTDKNLQSSVVKSATLYLNNKFVDNIVCESFVELFNNCIYESLSCKS